MHRIHSVFKSPITPMKAKTTSSMMKGSNWTGVSGTWTTVLLIKRQYAAALTFVLSRRKLIKSSQKCSINKTYSSCSSTPRKRIKTVSTNTVTFSLLPTQMYFHWRRPMLNAPNWLILPTRKIIKWPQRTGSSLEKPIGSWNSLSSRSTYQSVSTAKSGPGELR